MEKEEMENFRFTDDEKKSIKNYYEGFYAQMRHGVILSHSFYIVMLNNFGKEWCDKYVIHDELVQAVSSKNTIQNQGWWNRFKKHKIR